MKSFISRIFMAIVLVGLAAQPSFSATSILSTSNSTVSPIIQNAFSNFINLDENYIRGICTTNRDVANPDDPSCSTAINNCVNNYLSLCGAGAECSELGNPTGENRIFKCAEDPKGSTCERNFINIDGVQVIDAIENSCTFSRFGNLGDITDAQRDRLRRAADDINGARDNPGTMTPDQVAAPLNPDTNANDGSNVNQTTQTPAVGTAAGCSLSPLQASGSMGGIGLLSTLMMIPFALRIRKKK